MVVWLHMVQRQFWLQKIKKSLQKRSVLWLSGVRRAGKTMLCKSIPGVEYFDCELPSVRRMMEDPQSFLEDLKGRTIILDEIHRLSNPSEMLKIAADHFPGIKIVATGSSTLGASAKFKDTLAGRKLELWLTPMISEDLVDFKYTDHAHRFLHGGL
ncbi:MAG: AAA family ATPase, partial [Nitrospirae bacterium]|nr:AAA family ATPase [Nitrospirota bacterium]